MLNIPHLPPVLFLKEILEKSDKKAVTIVSFNSIPTLGMIMEAAAQSCSAFNSEKNEGYILSATNLSLHEEIKKTVFKIYIHLQMQSGNLSEFYFEAKDKKRTLASGSLLLMLNS